jgi:septal ring factor EnvC (AmiA/AmiB activator)
MKKKSLITKLVMASVVTSALVFTGCKHPDQDQISKLEEARGAAVSAEQQLAAKKNERVQLEQQVAAKEGELSTKQAEKEDVKQKMEARQ